MRKGRTNANANDDYGMQKARMIVQMSRKEFEKDFEELNRGAKQIKNYGNTILTNFRKNRNMNGSQTMPHRGYQSDGFISKYPV